MGAREGLSKEVTLELTLGDKGVSRSKSRRASQTVNGRFRGLRRKGLSIHNILSGRPQGSTDRCDGEDASRRGRRGPSARVSSLGFALRGRGSP